MAKLKSFKVNLNIPMLGSVIEGTWEPDERERNASWELYVELITRISVVELNEDEGILREALTSFYNLFGITRELLKKYGPDIAKPKDGSLSLGFLAVTILNTVVRPLLAYWHPLLATYEHTRPPQTSMVEHERKWERNQELRQAINEARLVLIQYASLLAEVSGVPNLTSFTSRT
jgi:hypothetical protein